MILRIYADFNSCDADGWLWCLRYNERPLDEVAEELGLVDGQAVIVFYEDESEEFEFDAVLSRRGECWCARHDDSTYRLLRDSSQ
jgi:hypothetical protein